MNEYVDYRKPLCLICMEMVDIWKEDDLMTDAWQKNGKNHFEFRCPKCGIGGQRVSIKIDNDRSRDVGFMGRIKRWANLLRSE